LLRDKDNIVSNRNLFRSPFFVMFNFVFYFLNLKNFLKKIKNKF